MKNNIMWYVCSCHLCQVWQTCNLLISPTVATPAPLFGKFYIDMMHMPKSRGFKYIVQGRCSLCTWPEWRNRYHTWRHCFNWGLLYEIVTDNGPAFIPALEYLSKCYHINHIRISGHNSCANSIVEHMHFDVRQSLFKAIDRDQEKWSTSTHSIFWAEHITVQKCMGCLPYLVFKSLVRSGFLAPFGWTRTRTGFLLWYDPAKPDWTEKKTGPKWFKLVHTAVLS
jgi:hypothetical protein